MSFSSLLVVGGTGFIGRHLVAKLVAAGYRVTVPTRRYQHAHPLALLPTVKIVEADVHNDAALDGLIGDVDAVINLVGILHSRPGTPYGVDFDKVHVRLPQRIVARCAQHGVRRYLHVSALGAAPDGPSMYLRSKAAGEVAAFSEPTVATTVFRPAAVFGAEDHFLNLFATLQKWLPIIFLAGARTKFQPVYVGDVALAMVHALPNAETFGKVYELAGPTIYALRDLVVLAGVYSGHRRPVIGLSPSLALLQAWLLEHLPGQPLMSRDNVRSMQIDNVASRPLASELALTPMPLEAVAPCYLAR